MPKGKQGGQSTKMVEQAGEPKLLPQLGPCQTGTGMEAGAYWILAEIAR